MRTVLLLSLLLASVSCATAPANIHGVLVDRHGVLLSEVYTPGSDRSLTSGGGLFASAVEFDANTLHDVRSVSKSIVGLEAGIVLARHPEVSLDSPVTPFFPELTDLPPDRAAITIRHLLTMTSGLEWNEWGRGILDSDETSLAWEVFPARKVLRKSPQASPGSQFNYSGGATQTLMQLLERLEHKGFLDLVRADLFGPMGITRWEWARNTQGDPLAYAGLRLLPRDMVKIGRLVLQNGVWEGQSVVPGAWISQSLSAQVETDIDLFSLDGAPVSYGYHWWTGTVEGPRGSVRWCAAIGNGGQRIFVVPDLDLVCVTTAGDYGDRAVQRQINQRLAELVAALVPESRAP